MARLGLWNIALGFAVISIAAAGGAFVANEITLAYVFDPAALDSWGQLMRTSSHGHTNLFGMLHILLGLTLPYSRCSLRLKLAQTLGLAAGVLAMGPGMLAKAILGPTAELSLIDVSIGTGLTLALGSLVSHTVAIAAGAMRADR